MKQRFAWLGVVSLWVVGACSDPAKESPEPRNEPSNQTEVPPRPEPQAALQPTQPSEVDQRVRPALASAPRVAGIVFGPEGAPQPGVKVSLYRAQSPGTKLVDTSLTSDEGRFSFREPRGPGLSVVAKRSGLARVEMEASELDPEVVVRMEHGFVVEGFVKNPAGDYVTNCTVILEPVAFSAHRAVSARTKRGGKFVFRDVPAGGARLTARHPGFRPATIPSIEVGIPKVHPLQFPSEHEIVLSGVVMKAGAEAEPVAGAVVRALPSSWNSHLFLPVEAKTDNKGYFELYGLGSGNLRIEVHHESHSTRVRTVGVRDETPDMQFELVPRSAFAGRLVGHSIRSGTELEISQPGEVHARTAVEVEGRFEFEGTLSAGSAELKLVDSDLCFAESGSRWLTVQIEEGGSTLLDLDVTPASVIRGVVQNSAGQPLEAVRVLWEQPTDGPLAPLRLLAVTDKKGAYEVLGLPRAFGAGLLGNSRFVYRRYGFAVGELTFAGAAPGGELDLDPVVLVRPGSISGRVMRHGKGIAGAVAFTGFGRAEVQRQVTGPDGSFVLRDLRPGGYRVKARYGTMALASSDNIVEVTAGAEVGPIELRFLAGRTITGRVVTPDGAAIDDAVIIVRGLRGSAFYSGADGEFTLEVPREDVELQVFADVELNVQTTVLVPISKTDEVVIELPMVRWGAVRAKVFGLPGNKPLAGGILRLDPRDGPIGDPVRDRQRKVLARWVPMNGGVLDLQRFPAGNTRLTLHCPGYAPLVREVSVAPDELVNLDTVLLEPGAYVRGVVSDTTDVPVADARVHLGDELDLATAPPEAAAFTDAEGRFTLQGVSANAARLVVSAKGYATVTRTLSLPEDLLRSEPLQVVLDRGSSITVFVENKRRDKELSFVILKKSGQRVASRWTDRDGRVTFEHRNPGTYEIDVLGEADAVRELDVLEEGKVYEVRIGTEAAK